MHLVNNNQKSRTRVPRHQLDPSIPFKSTP
ncbi:hypothetical protein M3Y98_00678400 [Aphelenchoides besseyi]|nr:hypothetical protein M3Y98_00678400 [Aphelenchoides besseyi]